jgi:SagB-type dehydrogenase family enzyme
VRRYHERTKHHPHRFAPSPGYLDWATQPDPFRTYAGAPVLEPSLLADSLAASYDDLFVPGAVEPRPLGVEAVALLFELALGLSAWKEYRGERWALRCNPSSGNLHPTEGYAILPEIPGAPAGLYHYVSRDHVLERRATLAGASAARLAQLLPPGSLLAGLSSIHWREAWKYGERAFRYCQHDAGHAIAALRFAAGALGWSARLLAGLGDADVASLLGLDRDHDFAELAAEDREHPDGVLLVAPTPVEPAAAELTASADELAGLLRAASWAGRPNPLSPSHRRWSAIDEASRATVKPRTADTEGGRSGLELEARRPRCRTAAAALIRRRRSAVAMDGTTTIPAETFYAMLDRLLPRPGAPPFDVLPWAPRVHLALFVHRVEGLTRGLYAFARDPGAVPVLRSALHEGFHWERPRGCPPHLPLFLLLPADCRSASAAVSCHQAIAADGAFSLGMLAELGRSLEEGPWWYRRLHWEAGVVGQALYLEAEAAGVRSTGIGCFFDDAFHEVLGLTDRRFQDLYHFTVGGPVEDRRLTTLPPYAHLRRQEGNLSTAPG